MRIIKMQLEPFTFLQSLILNLDILYSGLHSYITSLHIETLYLVAVLVLLGF